jgi:hypothetical protein
MHGLRNHFKRVLGGRLFLQANNVYVTQTPKQQLEIGSPLPDSSLPLKLGGVLFVYLVGGLVAMENMRMDSDPTDRWQQISQASLFKLAPLSQFVLSLICPRSKYDNALISLSSTMDQIDAAMRKSPQANPAIPHFLDDALFDILSCMWVWKQTKTKGETKLCPWKQPKDEGETKYNLDMECLMPRTLRARGCSSFSRMKVGILGRKPS